MSKIGLIISREFNVRVRKRSFIITTLLVPILMVAMMSIPALVAIYGGGSDTKTVVVSASSNNHVAKELKSSEEMKFMLSTTPYPDVVREHQGVYGYLVLGDDILQNPASAKLYSTKSATMEVQRNLEKQIDDIISSHRIATSDVEGLGEIINHINVNSNLTTYDIEVGKDNQIEHKSSSTGLYYAVAYAGGFIIYMFILIYGMIVLQGVVEEKSNRIIEVMVSSVRPFELMLGKILGIASVAVLQFLIWIALIVGLSAILLPLIGSGMAGAVDATAAMPAGGAQEIIQNSPIGGVLSVLLDPWFITRIFGSFLIYFVGGYLLYASMFAAVGSAVDNVADTQQLQIPITIPLILAIFLLMSVMNDPFSDIAFWGSMIPFTSPVIMMARVSYGVPLWEFALSVTLLYGTFIGMTYVAAKIYRTGIFMYGKKPTLREFLSWLRYK